MTEYLGEELFKLIEKSQGYAFISDDMDEMSNDEIIERAEDALDWELETVDILRRFIRKHKPRKFKSI